MKEFLLGLGAGATLINLLALAVISEYPFFNFLLVTACIWISTGLLCWILNSDCQDGLKVAMTAVLLGLMLLKVLLSLVSKNRLTGNVWLLALALITVIEILTTRLVTSLKRP